jgi:hypothetical protein
MGTNKIIDVATYILEKYPMPDELSNARLTKIIYLSDWRYVLTNGNQITTIKWYYDNHGPFVWDIKDELQFHFEYIAIKETTNIFGTQKCIFELKRKYPYNLSDEEKKTINFVIEKTKKKNWTDFIRIVYGTYPIINSDKYSSLNLIELAKQKKHEKQLRFTE